MRKFCVLGLMLVLFFGFTLVFAQNDPMMDFRKQQEAYLKTLQQNSPKLYEFEKKLMDIQNQMQQIMMDFQQNKITKERVRALVTPLIKEEIEIRNNPDYLVEQRLGMFLNMPKEQSAR
ncbi:MAG: hypothetical protein V1884_04595 [Candidatus Omnitrophota bacterium]